MTYLIRNKAFAIGFCSSILVFIALNIAVNFVSHCHHCTWITGFPLIFRQQFIGNTNYTPESGFTNHDFDLFSVWAFIADVFIILFISVGVGMLCDIIFSRLKRTTNSERLG